LYSIFPKTPTKECNFLFTLTAIENNYAYIQAIDRNKKRKRGRYLIFQID
jgi:hypothetical protein